MQVVYPETSSPEDIRAARDAQDFLQNCLLDMSVFGCYPKSYTNYLEKQGMLPHMEKEDQQFLSENTPDLIGINYYCSACIRAKREDDDDSKLPPFYRNELFTLGNNQFLEKTKWMEFGIDPKGLYTGMRDVYERYHLPMIVTENGLAYSDVIENGKIEDDYRINYHRDHIKEMENAIFEDGVDCLGYITWGPIDILASMCNMDKRYGFVYVNYEETFKKIKNFSSGQKIFLLTITQLILKLTERTVVFIDEPELFLHPPMVKSYVRLISDIVSSVNGLGFIITHSPITLQEFPNRCVKQAYRDYRGEYLIKSVNFNTFGENINVINDQIFNISLQQSGYYNLIERLKFVENGKSELRKLLDFSGSEARLLINLFLEGTSE